MVDLSRSRTDEELVLEYARSGNEEAMGELVRRHWASGFRLSLGALGDRAAAEDAAQEAFVWLVRKARRFDPARPFLPWFRTLVMNVVRTKLRSTRRQRALESRFAEKQAAASAAPEPEVAGASAGDEVREHLLRLPLDLRFPLILHYYEGCAHEEVAAALGCPKGTASSRIRRGLERLRQSLATAGCALSIADLETWFARQGASAAEAAAPAPPAVAALEAQAAKLAGAALAWKLVAAAIAVAVLGAGMRVLLSPDEPARVARSPSEGRNASGGIVSGREAAATNAAAGPASASDSPVPGSQAPGEKTPRSVPSEPGFRVRVVDSSGRPVSGAAVLLAFAAPPGPAGATPLPAAFTRLADLVQRAEEERSSLPGATTAASGTAVLDVPPIDVLPPGAIPDVAGTEEARPAPTGAHFLLLARRGLLRGRREGVDLAAWSRSPLDVVVKRPDEVERERGAFLAKIAGPDGRPLAGTRLRVSIGPESLAGFGVAASGEGAAVFERETDGDGRAALAGLLPDTYRIEIAAPEMRPWLGTVAVKEGDLASSDVRLEDGVRLTGRVLAASGAALDGATVSIRCVRCDGDAGSAGRVLPLDALGRFRAAGLVPGTWEVEARAPGFIRVSARVTVVRGEAVVPDLTLGRGVLVTGRAVSASGQPVAGVSILLATSDPALLGEAQSSEDGSFRLAGLPAGASRLSLTFARARATPPPRDGPLAVMEETTPRIAGASPPVERSIDVVDGGEAALGDIVVRFPDGRLAGRVLVATGHGVKGALVRLSGPDEQSTRSDLEGRFSFEVAEGKGYRLAAQSDDLVSRPVPPAIVAAIGETRVDLELVPAGTISGRAGPSARAASGAPVIVVAINHDDAGRSGWALADADGRYRIRGLVPGDFTVRLADASFSREVAVASGSEVTADLVAPAATARAVVRLRGIDRATSFSAVAYAGRFAAVSRVLAGAVGDGRVMLEGLEAGTLGIAVTPALPGGSPGNLTVFRDDLALREGETLELELALPEGPTGKLSGRLSSPPEASEPLRVVALGEGVLVQGDVRADGTFDLERVPPGRFKLVASAPGARVTFDEAVSVTVEAGRTATATVPVGGAR